ncbi:MAG: DUF4136 domain-containing protein [Acidobacteria bacterium]|nr:DUF4136 domain-containing protein [Acidobacteriota bacterium]
MRSRRAAGLAALAWVVAFACVASVGAAAQGADSRQSPQDVLRSARTIFVRSKSVYFKPSTLENSLLQYDEFTGWGMSVTRDEAGADLIVEVGRKVFTTSFVFSVIDPKTQRVVASGRVNSIGGTVEGKIASSLMKKLRAAHGYAPAAEKK